jgi:AcrR family transcriptional regulator
MSKGTMTRDRASAIALAMATESGLAGLTIATVADRAGLSKSGLFAHFGSKEALQLEVLTAATELAEEIVIAPCRREPPGRTRLRAFVRLWMGWTTRAGLPGGCPFAAAVFELDDYDGPVREHVETTLRGIHSFITSMVHEAIELGELRPDTDADQVAWELGAIYLGHHVASRFLRDPDAEARASAAVDALLARHDAASPDQLA